MKASHCFDFTLDTILAIELKTVLKCIVPNNLEITT